MKASTEKRRRRSKSAAPPDHRRVVILTKSLPCALTEAEELARGRDLARVSEDIQTEETRQADLRAEMKARIAALEAERIRLASVVRRREEWRDVIVHEIFSGTIVNQVRIDTGEEIATREMTESERQGLLPLDETAAGR